MPHADRPYLFDARSAGWERTTGWERYAREIARRIGRTDPQVNVRVAGSQGVRSRVWQDLLATPAASRHSRVVHYPTFPPVPWAGTGGSLVYTLHDLTWWRWRETASAMGRHYYAPLAAAAARGRAHIVTDTAAVADEVAEEFGLARSDITVVPLGAELAPPDPGAARARPYLLTVGTLEPRKNLARLAEAYRRSGVSASHDLVVVGRVGWGEHPTGVEVVSGLDDGALAAMYAGAAALVLPSLYEGFGLPAVEAMQLGVPVVCADIPVLREVTDGRATYVDATDVDLLVDALRAALSAIPAPGGAEWASQTYRWDRTVEALSTLYRRLDQRSD